MRQFRSVSTARGRVAHLTAFFGRVVRAAALTTHQIRQYQLARRAAGAATGTINRETSALHRMCTLAVHWGWLDTVPGFPDRLRENPPRQGFFEHPEYLAVRAHLPAPWQDILDVAYYSGWRKQEILGLTWDEIDEAGGVIRLSPGRSKTLVGRILPISAPIAEALARRRARRDPDSPLVFHRDGIPVRRWRTAWRTACQAAGVPTRFLHDCRRTAARNLIRANVPERVAMLLTGHKSRAIFDRYNIIHEQELLDAGDQLVEYLAQQAQAVPARQRHRAQQRGDTRSQALSTPVAGASMMAPLPTTAHVHMTAKKTLYLANPYGFSAQQRGGPLHELVRALELMGADVWEPFARNNQIDRASAGWAYRIGQADLRDVREADGLFAVVNGCPPDEGVMVELGLGIAWEKPVFLFRDDFRRCTDSEMYPLNLMLFTGLPAAGWEAAWYGSIEEIADPAKALARWLRHDRPPGAVSVEADPIEV